MGSRQKQLSESERCIREYLCIFPHHCVFSFRSTKHKNCFCIFVWRNRTRFLPFVFFVSIPFKASFFHCSSMTCNGWDQFRWREKEIFDEEKYLKIHIFSVFYDDCSVRPPVQALHTTWNLVFLFYLISQFYVNHIFLSFFWIGFWRPVTDTAEILFGHVPDFSVWVSWQAKVRESPYHVKDE